MYITYMGTCLDSIVINSKSIKHHLDFYISDIVSNTGGFCLYLFIDGLILLTHNFFTAYIYAQFFDGYSVLSISNWPEYVKVYFPFFLIV